MDRKIILASHGEMARGMANSAKMILGDMADALRAYGLMPGRTAREFVEELETEIAENPSCEYVILTDLYGASVCNAMYELLKYKNVVLFSGMNLNLLLLLCTDRTVALQGASVEELLEESRGGLRQLKLEIAENEDF